MNTNVVACPQCGVKNRIPIEKPESKTSQPKCGRCGTPLVPNRGSQESLTLRCSQCRTKNRVPVAKLHAGANCGQCSAPLQHQDLLSGRTVMVTDANFAQTVMQSPLPVLLYAWAPWCSVCGSTGPTVDQLALETKGKIRVGKVNIDANPTLSSKYNILSVPAFFIFDAGQLKTHLPGAVPKHELMLKLAAFI